MRENVLKREMHMEIPEDAAVILETLTKAGFEAFVVGGCVRDCLMGRKPKDWDITTSAKPLEVKALFRKTIDTGIKHGTVTVMMHHEGYEVTTYRIDGEYEDSRHPKEVTFTRNLLEDLKRRDFTINAMAYNPDTGVVDAFDGIGDLERGLIRCVGDPEERFTEDALRMMRAVRFAAQLGFEIDGDTAAAVRKLAPRLSGISAERVQMELVKLLTSGNPRRISTACDLGITAVVLPEYDRIRGESQHAPNHIYDVELHTLVALENVRPETALRLAVLMHDFAKPSVRKPGEDRDYFPDHAKVSADMAGKILQRLKFDNHTKDRVVRLIRWHSLKYDADEVSVRRVLKTVGEDLFEDFLEVQRADVMGKRPEIIDDKLALLDQKKAIYEKVISEGQCFNVRGLAAGGKDLIAAGIRPGPALGDILDWLTDCVIEDQSLNTKEKLIEMALEKAGSGKI